MKHMTFHDIVTINFNRGYGIQVDGYIALYKSSYMIPKAFPINLNSGALRLPMGTQKDG